MSASSINRRNALKGLGAITGLAVIPQISVAKPTGKSGFIYSLNMSTIRGQKLGFIKELEVASKAGFKSVEIWMDSLQTYLSSGGSLADARQKLKDLDLKVENCIGFAPWIVDDESARIKGLEQMKKEMNLLAELGCKRTAAPPVGATNTAGLDLNQAAERYRAVLELGDQTGVVPHLELWGFSKNLSRLSEVMYVATESGHPAAKVLLDVYHLYKGQTSLASLPLVGKPAIEIFHVNDYAASTTPATITDGDRIYTGEGVAPIKQILKSVKSPDKPLIISFEVFNKNYYAQDALEVAKTALAKMKAVTKDIA